MSPPNGSAAPAAPAALLPPVFSAPRELALSESSLLGEPPLAPLRRLACRLRDADARIIGLMLFGSLSDRARIERAVLETLGERDWPMLWVDGASCHGAPLAGVQAFALTGATPEPVRVGGEVVASRYRIGRTELCWLGAASPRDPRAAPGEQTSQAFAALQESLRAAGFILEDLVRTWCYNKDLLAWYPEFNHARSRLYRGLGFRLGAPPASTGISAANPAGAALVLAGLAARSLSGGPVARPLLSPLQCPAEDYGSSFSRAVELELGATRRVLVSGTASIEPGGATAWAGEASNQIELTMEVIETLLRSRGLAWRDVIRGLAYFKSPVFSGAFDAWCLRHGWENPPVVRLHCDICRDDLLFELEVDAETSTGG